MLVVITVRGRKLNTLNKGMSLVRTLKISKNRLKFAMINTTRNTFFVETWVASEIIFRFLKYVSEIGVKIEKNNIKMIIWVKIERGTTRDMKRHIKILNENHEINSSQFLSNSNSGSINFDLVRSKLNKKNSPRYHTIFKGIKPEGRKFRISVIWIKDTIKNDDEKTNPYNILSRKYLLIFSSLE